MILYCKYDVCQSRGISALSGEQFPPTLCGRVGEAAPLLLNKTIKLQPAFLSSLGSQHVYVKIREMKSVWWRTCDIHVLGFIGDKYTDF